MDRVLPDESVLESGQMVRLVRNGVLDGCQIVVSAAVSEQLRRKAARGRDAGLREMEQLRTAARSRGIPVENLDDRPGPLDDPDSAVLGAARSSGAELFTSRYLRAASARAEGIPVQHHQSRAPPEPSFAKYFDDATMSVHLREGQPPMAKRGRPGAFELAKVSDEELSRSQLDAMADELRLLARPDVSLPGADVIQHDRYRVAVTRPPFSDAAEITIVRPAVSLELEDYGLSDSMMDRFSRGAEGILISGAPGSGKSTLASALANFYHRSGKVVKTLESPRDLQVDEGVTQYAKLDGSFENSADMLLLVRPDYTIFDEVRRREDFGVYSDLRMTGVGTVGVVHANSPIDAIQRFVGKIELGVIPSVIDTVVYVKDGRISKVYGLELKVKVPSGMAEQDLARPVIVISDFEGGKPEYEIYTFGEENVIMPVQEGGGATGSARLAGEKLRELVLQYDPRAEVEVTGPSSAKVRVARGAMSAIIGRGGSNISALEKRASMHIDVSERDGDSAGSEAVPCECSESRSAVMLEAPGSSAWREADVLAGGQVVATVRVGRGGRIKVPRHSRDGRRLRQLHAEGVRLEIRGA